MNKDYRRRAKVLLVDIEVSPSLSWNYGQYQTNAIAVEKPPVLLSFAWKWLGDKGEPKCLTILDRPLVDRFDHTLLVKELWKLMDEAEVVVAHNINFDIKMANAFFLRCGMNPPSWYKPFCTLKTAKKYFKLDNNKLDYLGKLLGVGQKTATTHADVWYDMLFGNKKEQKVANKLMKSYNVQDVSLLEKIYNRLLPFADNHPNMALAAGIDYICPRCGHESDFVLSKYRKTGTQVNAIQVKCKHCNGYVTRRLTNEERQELEDTGSYKAIFRNITA